MTAPSEDRAAARDVVDDLSDQLARHARLLQVIRAHMATWAPAGLDWAAFTLLMTLVKQGPRRQGELAELALLDPSTVSRHVAQLVRAGLVERRPDPADGRALLLAVAPAGEQMAQDMIRRRRELVRQAIEHWQPDDVRSLARLLGRLNDDLDAYRPRLIKPVPQPPEPAPPGPPPTGPPPTGPPPPGPPPPGPPPPGPAPTGPAPVGTASTVDQET